MPQHHYVQSGTFHITTNASGIPWCTRDGIPQILIDNLCMTRNIQEAELYAFCILPDHMHILFSSGPKGLSKFMHSFKKNSSRDIANFLCCDDLKWQKGYYDERIQDGTQRGNVIRYIQNNPLRHGLVDNIEDWKWTSLHFQDLLDPMEYWFD